MAASITQLPSCDMLTRCLDDSSLLSKHLLPDLHRSRAEGIGSTRSDPPGQCPSSPWMPAATCPPHCHTALLASGPLGVFFIRADRVSVMLAPPPATCRGAVGTFDPMCSGMSRWQASLRPCTWSILTPWERSLLCAMTGGSQSQLPVPCCLPLQSPGRGRCHLPLALTQGSCSKDEHARDCPRAL